jgi:PAS domain S-box-containing protein
MHVQIKASESAAHVSPPAMAADGNNLQAALEESQNNYRQLVLGLPSAAYTCDEEGRVTLFNGAAAELWGRAPELGKDLWCGSWRIYHADGTPMPLDQCPMAIAFREGRAVRDVEVIIERPDGTRRNVLTHPQPLLDLSGSVIGAFNMLVDVTDRKRDEAKLIATQQDPSLQIKALSRLHELAIRLAATSEAQPALQAILEALVEAHHADFGLLSLYDAKTGCLAPAASVGFDAAALDQCAGVSPGPTAGACGSAFATQERAVIEDVECDPRFASYLPLARAVGFRAVHSTPMLTRSGEVLGAISVQFKCCRRPTQAESQLADMCARHAAEATDAARSRHALWESEQRLRLATQTGKLGIWDWDIIADRISWTDSLYSIHGIETGDFPATVEGFTQLVHPLDREAVSAAIQRALEEDAPYEVEFRALRPDGSVVWLFTNASVVRENGRPVRMLGATMDITANKRAIESLRESEQRFRRMADYAPVMIWVTEADGRCSFLGKTWYDFTGRSASESMGFGWIEAMHPDDRQIARETFLAANDRHEEFQHEYRLLSKDGTYYWMIDAAVPRFADDGTFLGYIGSVIDISSRKKVEEALRESQAALLEADRRKDEFLALLAHELRNPLAPIRTGLELLRLAGDDRSVIEEVRVTMDRQSQQMVRLIDDLLDMSRITRGSVELRKGRVELAWVVESAVETARPAIEELEHKLEITLPARPVVLEADPTRLAQVISNLLNNAAKYMKRGGSIRLTAERHEDSVLISVKDSGIGIPADMIARIFDMFVQVDGSLERSHGGLGIGLTLVKRLVEMHGGNVEARSDGLDRGSEFIVRLPIVRGLLEEPNQLNGQSKAAVSKRRILVVDDNENAAQMLGMLLKALGNEVRTVFDGYSAITQAGEFRPDVVLLDIGMPSLNGYDTARLIRREPWGKQMILAALTGWGQEDDKRRTREAGFDHHFVKPVEPAVLQKFISECVPSGR